eukprot:760977-Hanusia_phi.AAC.3
MVVAELSSRQVFLLFLLALVAAVPALSRSSCHTRMLFKRLPDSNDSNSCGVSDVSPNFRTLTPRTLSRLPDDQMIRQSGTSELRASDFC